MSQLIIERQRVLDALEPLLRAAAPHSDQPGHHDGERGGEAGGRA